MIFRRNIWSLTLAEVKEYCTRFMCSHDAPCENKDCEFKWRNICMNYVHEWNFDRLTQEELEICMSLGAKWVTRDAAEPLIVQLWAEKPNCNTFDGKKTYESLVYNGLPIAQIEPSKFQSVKPGDCISVEDLLNG